MPERLSYDEAMMFASARLKITDPELKQGQVEKVTVQTKAGPMDRPWGIEGGFAVVYKFRTKSGQFRALRCFRVPMSPDMQFRYERIGPYFHKYAPDITAGFKYHPSGILIKEATRHQSQNPVYPIIEMEWIEGMTLLEKVDELCRKKDILELEDLTNQWLLVLQTLRHAHIAHGDLSGGNVMVRTDGKLVLVDYDGVYIPEFANLQQAVLGQEDYQHPQFSKRQFNERMDDFSALVIYTALLVLQARPTLWYQYTKRDTLGQILDTKLLFEHTDFEFPEQSALMADLEKISEPRARTAVQKLKEACKQSIDQVYFPFAAIDPDYDREYRIGALEKAIQNDDEEQIVASWSPGIEMYGQVKQYIGRVELAQKRLKALLRFRAALQTQNIQQITSSYDPILNGSKNVTQQERERFVLARSFVQAYIEDDDDAIVASYNQIQNTQYQKFFTFTPREVQRITLAQQRRDAVAKFRAAMASKRPQEIAAAYDPALESYRKISAGERGRIDVALKFMKAYAEDDDDVILAAYDDAQEALPSGFFIFTQEERHRVELARLRKTALIKLRAALMSKRPQEIAAAYDPALESYRKISAGERERIDVALKFMKAYAEDDDDVILAAYDIMQEVRPAMFFIFSEQEKQRIELAQRRKAALTKWRLALLNNGKKAVMVLSTYDPILDTCKSVTKEEREKLDLARRFLEMYSQVEEAIRIDDDEKIVSAYDESLASKFTDIIEEHDKRIKEAQNRHGLEAALNSREYGLALRTAQSIEMASRKGIDDFRLTLARSRFISSMEPKNLEVRREGNEVWASWQWPTDDLVQYVAIVWRTDRWPRNPKVLEPGTTIYHVHRSSYAQQNGFRFKVGQQALVYVQVYSAIPDFRGPAQEKIWYYSKGDEPTSKALISQVHTVDDRTATNLSPSTDRPEYQASSG